MECLDEQTVVAFVNGDLTGDALTAVERHLLTCSDCTMLVALAAQAPDRKTPAHGPTGSPPREPTPQAIADPISTVRETAEPPVGAASPPGAGSTVGRYRLLHLVGRGGMGEVYAAHDPKLDRKVAIKILRADTYADDVESARLLREAQSVARLSHPNLVTVYDVGTAGGRLFLAMELIEGETLASWLDGKRRSRADIVRVFTMAGRGLAAAHRAGVVHRDFKPQNVMVADDGTARVMDFGLAALGEARNEPRLTRIGSILGTPLYMAPEQLRGQPVDPRADQFSFCVSLYEALYGERPFAGENFPQLRTAVLGGNVRPAPLASGVPRRLRSALLRGLSVDRARRWPDMDAVVDAVEAASVGRSHMAPLLAGAGAAAVLVAAGGLVWQLRRPPSATTCNDAPAKLEVAWPKRPDAARRADVRAAFLHATVPDARERHARTSQALDAYADAWLSIHRAGCDARARGEPPALRSLRQRCLEGRAEELGALVDVLAHADAKIVRKSIAAALALPPLDVCADAAALKTMAAMPDNPAIAGKVQQLRRRLAALRALAAAGHDWQAMKPLAALVEEARITGDEALLADALLVYARARSPFDPEAAAAVYEEAFKHGESLHNDELAAEAAIQLIAIVGAIQHHFDDGERWARLADAILERDPSRVSRLRGWFVHNRGTLHAARGRWLLAEGDFTAAVALRQRGTASAQPELATSMVHLARAVLTLDEPERAMAMADRALTVADAIFPADSFEVATARLIRGRALVALDRAAEARADLEAVMAIFEPLLGRDHPFLAEPMTGLGEVALAEGRPMDAQGLLERAWEMRSTQTADGGAREETAFHLALAIWEASPTDRRRALELAAEARDGYAAMPELAHRLATVDRWLADRRAARTVSSRTPRRL